MMTYAWKKLNRYYIYILFVVIPLALFLKAGSMISENMSKINELQRRNEQLQEKNADMGFTYREVMDTGLFNSDYYVEITLEDSENWNRQIKEDEKDFMQRSRYYLLDRNTMICVAQNDGGRVYILMRD